MDTIFFEIISEQQLPTGVQWNFGRDAGTLSGVAGRTGRDARCVHARRGGRSRDVIISPAAPSVRCPRQNLAGGGARATRPVFINRVTRRARGRAVAVGGGRVRD